MDWKKISLELLLPFGLVLGLCLIGIRSLGLTAKCQCFTGNFGTSAVLVVALFSLIATVPTILAVKKDWKTDYTILLIFLFLIMLAVSLLLGEAFYNPSFL